MYAVRYNPEESRGVDTRTYFFTRVCEVQESERFSSRVIRVGSECEQVCSEDIDDEQSKCTKEHNTAKTVVLPP